MSFRLATSFSESVQCACVLRVGVCRSPPASKRRSRRPVAFRAPTRTRRRTPATIQTSSLRSKLLNNLFFSIERTQPRLQPASVTVAARTLTS